MTWQEIDQLIQRATMKLLDESRFYGEVLLRLKRVYDETIPGTMGLSWQAPYWELRVNPLLFEEVYHNVADTKGALLHQVLHIVWEHPTRYAQQLAGSADEHKIVGLATDLAVNQYIRGGFPGARTLAEVETVTKLSLPTYADSGTYYSLLYPLMENVDTAGAGQQLPGDSHEGWSAGFGVNDEATAALKNLVSDANHDAIIAGRGTMPGDVARQIDRLTAPRRNWRGLLRQAMSNIAAQTEPSRARFNRRQPYRMELPGQIATTQTQVAVFVDNSASISDEQAGRFMAEMVQMQQQLEAMVTFYAFDTQTQQVNADWLLTGQRRAGGGTAFAPIFTQLKQQHFRPDATVVLILTDGDGEAEIPRTPFRHVLWLLTPDGELSVQQPIGKTITLDW